MKISLIRTSALFVAILAMFNVVAVLTMMTSFKNDLKEFAPSIYHPLTSDDHFEVDSCTTDQLNTIELQFQMFKIRSHKLITLRTKCPSTPWLSKYYKEHFHNKDAGRQSFLAINVGCNGGFDTLDMARMGTSNGKFDKVTWREAIGAEKDSGVCEQANDINVEIQNNHMIEGEIHCIEPLPVYQKLPLQRQMALRNFPLLPIL